MNKRAVISFTKSKILPVKVEFPKHVAHYKDLDSAMLDIKLFKCTLSFKA